MSDNPTQHADTVHMGDPLTQAEVDALPEGTAVEVVWSGGNGPHRYLLVRDDRGRSYAVGLREDPHGPMRYYNPLDFVGLSPLTEVCIDGWDHDDMCESENVHGHDTSCWCEERAARIDG
jgi:hypothetical protein